MLLLGKVSDHMCAFAVALAQDVKQEGIDIVVESLVIQEQFGDLQIMQHELKKNNNNRDQQKKKRKKKKKEPTPTKQRFCA